LYEGELLFIRRGNLRRDAEIRNDTVGRQMTCLSHFGLFGICGRNGLGGGGNPWLNLTAKPFCLAQSSGEKHQKVAAAHPYRILQ